VERRGEGRGLPLPVQGPSRKGSFWLRGAGCARKRFPLRSEVNHISLTVPLLAGAVRAELGKGEIPTPLPPTAALGSPESASRESGVPLPAGVSPAMRRNPGRAGMLRGAGKETPGGRVRRGQRRPRFLPGKGPAPGSDGTPFRRRGEGAAGRREGAPGAGGAERSAERRGWAAPAAAGEAQL